MARSVIVLGAGLSGLACAFDLREAGADVRVLDAAERPGGVVGTIRENGFLFERGPNTVQASAEAFRVFCGDLGLADRMISSSENAKERYLFLKGELRALPGGPLSFLTSSVLSLSSKLRILSEPLRRYTAPTDNEPDLATFLSDRLGAEAANTLAGAFVRGVYAAELDELGAESAFPKLYALARDHGGLVRGMFKRKKPERTAPLPGPDVARTALLSFPNGLQELVDRAAELLGESLLCGFRAETIRRDGDGWCVRSEDGREERAERIVLAVPAAAAARVLSEVLAGSESLARLEAVTHAAVVLVHLGLDEAAFGPLPPGFGYLVPPSDEPNAGAPRVMGTIFSSSLFPGRAPEGSMAISSFYRAQDVEGLEESKLVDLAREDIAKALKRSPASDVRASAVLRWKGVIPRYSIGHAPRVRAIEAETHERAPGIDLCGAWTGGVSVDQVIARGREVAQRIRENA